jgi:HK97 family phage prohead protease
MTDATPLFEEVQPPGIFDSTQFRAAEIVEVKADEGIIEARIAPYESEAQLDARLFEVFSTQCFSRAANAPSRVKMWAEHGGPLIGCAREVNDRSDGVWVRAKFSNTLAGQEARELASDGTYDHCSVEFKPLREWMKVERRADGLHVRHSRAQLFGFALTTRPIYQDAYISSVRDEQQSKERDAIRARLLGLNH